MSLGLVDLEGRKMIDMVKGNAAVDLRRWCAGQDPGWLGGVRVVATDLAESYRAGISPHLDHAIRVADPFHVVRSRQSLRRQGAPAGAERDASGTGDGRTIRSIRIRKLLLLGSERLDERGTIACCSGLRHGDPHDELLGAWLAKESVRDVYLTDDCRGRRPARQGHRRLSGR